jgi:DNA-binding beta-propeller fold protein YncE
LTLPHLGRCGVSKGSSPAVCAGADANGDTVSIVDLETEAVVKTINVAPFPGVLYGSLPNGLAMLDDAHLVVSLSRNNALAVFVLGQPLYGAAKFLGMIPTGWYPTDVVVDHERNRLVVPNGKGVGSLGPEAEVGPDPSSKRTGRWVHSNMGSVSIIDVPNDDDLHLPRMVTIGLLRPM